MSAPGLDERFWAKVNKSGSCWIWTGAKNQFGYGIVRIAGRAYSVHRVAYANLVEPIRDGGYIDHKCYTPACVNPEHLQQVTNRQNVENRQGPNPNSSTGVRGVIWDSARGKYRVDVKSNYKTHHGGRFDSLAEAEARAIELRNELMTNNLADRVAS